MKLSEVFLYESRRNPSMNPRVSPLVTFSMYGNRKDVFVSYTRLKKLGINPQSDYNTPIGIYSYPLDYVLERAYKIGSIQGAARFAAMSEYVHLFQQTSSKVLDLASYTKSMYEKDLDKLIKYIAARHATLEQAVKSVELYDKHYGISGRSYGAKIWYITNSLVQDYMKDKRRTIGFYVLLHKVLGYDWAWDRNGEGIIHKNEPTQAVHFNIRTIKLIETVENVGLDHVGKIAREENLKAMTKDVVRETTVYTERLNKLIRSANLASTVRIFMNPSDEDAKKEAKKGYLGLYREFADCVGGLADIFEKYSNVLDVYGDHDVGLRVLANNIDASFQAMSNMLNNANDPDKSKNIRQALNRVGIAGGYSPMNVTMFIKSARSLSSNKAVLEFATSLK